MAISSTILGKSSENAFTGRKSVTPEDIDKRIRKAIEDLTNENHTVWSLPEYDKREFLRGIFQYPAMMVPAVQQKIVDIIVDKKPDIENVLDPFMGSASSLIPCMYRGLNCYGQDINPLSILIGKVKTGPYYIKALPKKMAALISRIENDTEQQLEADFKTLTKWFKPEVSHGLSKIVRAIRQERQVVVRRFFWINLAEIIRFCSNDRTSTFKLHARPLEEIEKRNIDPIALFKQQLVLTFQDYKNHYKLLIDKQSIVSGHYKFDIQITLDDSSKNIYTPEATTDFFDLMVTSPPYGDNHTTVTYGQYSFLPLQWIDFADIDSTATEDVLKTGSEIDSKSLGGKKRSDLVALEQLFDQSPSFKKAYHAVHQIAPDKVNKVIAFVGDLEKVITNIFAVMKSNSYQVWTIGDRTVAGITIPNGDILREMMEYRHAVLVDVIEREILNKRMASRNNNSALMTTEEILIFRKIG